MYRLWNHQAVKILAVLLLLLVICGGLWPQPVQAPLENSDKLTHLVAFFILAVVWLVGFLRQSYVFVVLMLVGVGLSIELIQGWLLPARYCDLGDLLMNVLGTLLGAFFVELNGRTRAAYPVKPED